MKLEITLTITEERVDELLNGHTLNCGHTPWWHSMEGHWWNQPGGQIVVHERENDSEKTRRMVVKAAHVKRGLEIMARDYGHAWQKFVDGNDDWHTCDLAWQCIVYGKEVFG